MQTLEWTTIDKSNWGEGPWQTEADKKQWMDKETRLPCLILRGPTGSLCGYVGVSEGHPVFNKEYDDVDVTVHGGLTFSDFCQPHKNHSEGICHLVENGENDRIWWLGFDTAHCFDYSPELAATLRSIGSNVDRSGEIYRDFDYVTSQVESLAQQLASM